MFIGFLITFLFFQSNETITIQLSKERIENSERIGFTNLDFKSDTFIVNEVITRCFTGYDFMLDKTSYTKHTPIMIRYLNIDSLLVLFDDNNDGVFEDRAPIKAKVGTKLNTYLLFKHSNDEEKDVIIDCKFEIVENEYVYKLNVYYDTLLKGTFKVDDYKYEISFWESMDQLDLNVNNDNIRSGNPIRFGKSFYKVKEYDPVLKRISFYKLEEGIKLHGNREGLYINENDLKQAFSFHDIDFQELNKKEYNLFYFWGHWCYPCIKDMPKTSEMFKDISDQVGIFSISYLLNKIDPIEEEIIVHDIIKNSI